MSKPYIPWSEREGLTQVRTQIQADGMDAPLRTGLWSAFWIAFMEELSWQHRTGGSYINPNLTGFVRGLWIKLLKRPIDELPSSPEGVVREIKEHFFSCPWTEVYNIIEFAAQYRMRPEAARLVELANPVLEREMSAWRFVGHDLVRRIADTELKAIVVAWQDSEPCAEVHKQLRNAVAEFSARGSPNYAHAAKEAVSAVETLCRQILRDDTITLGDALRGIRERGKPGVHPALLGSFEKLWGYASDKGLVRHGAKPGDPSEVTMEEAQLVLVMCHAIVSFLIARGRDEGVL